jgi:hypothetical protein
VPGVLKFWWRCPSICSCFRSARVCLISYGCLCMCASASIHMNLRARPGNSCAAASTVAHMSTPLLLGIEGVASTDCRRLTPSVHVQPVAPESTVATHCLASVSSSANTMRQTTCEGGPCDLAALAATHCPAIAVVAQELMTAVCVRQPRASHRSRPTPQRVWSGACWCADKALSST